jgi:hypothetical protein
MLGAGGTLKFDPWSSATSAIVRVHILLAGRQVSHRVACLCAAPVYGQPQPAADHRPAAGLGVQTTLTLLKRAFNDSDPLENER